MQWYLQDGWMHGFTYARLDAILSAATLAYLHVSSSMLILLSGKGMSDYDYEWLPIIMITD